MDSKEAANIAAIKSAKINVWLVIFGGASLIISALTLWLTWSMVYPSDPSQPAEKGWITVKTAFILLAFSTAASAAMLLVVAFKRLKNKRLRAEISKLETSVATETEKLTNALQESKESKKIAKEANLRADDQRNQKDSLYELKQDLERQLAKWKWLILKADGQAQEIGKYVAGKVRYCYPELDAPIPHLMFAVDIYNSSFFEITIEDNIGGDIRLAGERLLGDKEVFYPLKIASRDNETLNIKQRLTLSDIELVDKYKAAPIYYINKLVIMIAGRTDYPQFERTELKIINDRCGPKDSGD